MTQPYAYTAILFDAGYGKGAKFGPIVYAVAIPVADAFSYYESEQRGQRGFARVIGAIGKADDGREFTTWAKEWTVWDVTAQVHRIERIGYGANGDSGEPFYNPEVKGKRIRCLGSGCPAINFPPNYQES